MLGIETIPILIGGDPAQPASTAKAIGTVTVTNGNVSGLTLGN